MTTGFDTIHMQLSKINTDANEIATKLDRIEENVRMLHEIEDRFTEMYEMVEKEE